MARLAEGVNVVLRNPETGAPEVFSSGSDLPDWAADQVTNPDVLVFDQGGYLEPGVSEVVNDTDVPELVQAVEPPRAGKGSSRDASAAYAENMGVVFPVGASRDDIIAAVDEANAQQ